MTFQDIAILAKDIHSNYFNNQINQKVQVISSTPQDKTLVSYINMAFSEEITIDILKTEYRMRHIYGRFQRYNNNYALVVVSDSLNTCWTRYVAAKELCHLLVDKTASSMTTDFDNIINWLLDGYNIGIDDSLDSEHIAAQFAAELLLPYSTTIEDMENQTIDSYDIAQKFSVPKKIVDVMRTPIYLGKRKLAYSI